MGLLILIAFISGFLTIFSPCVLPILPVVLSSSLNKSAFYAFSLTLGILTTFTSLLLGFSFVAKILQINIEVFRSLSFFVIFISGLAMIFPQFHQLFEKIFKIKAIPGNEAKSTDYLSGFLTGASLGVLWSPCAGPILATVAMLVANQILNFLIFMILISYNLGVFLSIFTVVLVEQWLFAHQHRLSKLSRVAQVSAGIIMIVSVFLIYFGYDKVIWAKIAPLLPFNFKTSTQLEKTKPVQRELQRLKRLKSTLSPTINNLPSPTTFVGPLSPTLSIPTTSPFLKAPEITGIVKWFNTKNNAPIFLKDLRGKVVLLDFWTYTCAACIPDIEFLKYLQQKYKDRGFLVVSIHTPGYEEAKSEANVKAAIDRYQVTYPVGMDNDWKTFDAYKNNYWPTKVLIDRQGYIRFRHEGGGEREKVEKAVIELLNSSY